MLLRSGQQLTDTHESSRGEQYGPRGGDQEKTFEVGGEVVVRSV